MVFLHVEAITELPSTNPNHLEMTIGDLNDGVSEEPTDTFYITKKFFRVSKIEIWFSTGTWKVSSGFEVTWDPLTHLPNGNEIVGWN